MVGIVYPTAAPIKYFKEISILFMVDLAGLRTQITKNVWSTCDFFGPILYWTNLKLKQAFDCLLFHG